MNENSKNCDVRGLVADWPMIDHDLREQFLEDYPQLAAVYGLKLDDPYDNCLEVIGEDE